MFPSLPNMMLRVCITTGNSREGRMIQANIKSGFNMSGSIISKFMTVPHTHIYGNFFGIVVNLRGSLYSLVDLNKIYITNKS